MTANRIVGPGQFPIGSTVMAERGLRSCRDARRAVVMAGWKDSGGLLNDVTGAGWAPSLLTRKATGGIGEKQGGWVCAPGSPRPQTAVTGRR